MTSGEAFLRWLRRVAVGMSVTGLLLVMTLGAMAPNLETLPVRLPLSRMLPSLSSDGDLAIVLRWTGYSLAVLGLAGMLWARKRGWQPSPRRLFLGSAVVVAIMVCLTPVGSSDTASYAAYGRIAATGGNPYLTNPYAWHDPAYLALIGTKWRRQPSVYGPVTTAIQWFAASIGGADPAVTIWVWMIVNGAVFLAVGLLLLRTSADPVRATLLWTANPLLLQQLVLGGHVDTLLAAVSLCAIAVIRRGNDTDDTLAGILLGLDCGIKANAALIVAGLAWTLLRRSEWRRAARIAGVFLVTFAVEYSGYGLVALRPLFGGLKLVTIVSPWRGFQALGGGLGVSRGVLMALTTLLWPVAMLLVAWLVSQRIATDEPREAVAAFALTFAWVIVAPWALAWYTAMSWAALTQVPRTRMTRWLLLVTMVLALGLSRGGQAHPEVAAMSRFIGLPAVIATKAKYIAKALTGSAPGVEQGNHARDGNQRTGPRPLSGGKRRYWQLLPIAVAFWGLDGLEKLRKGAHAAGLSHAMTDERISHGIAGSLAERMNHWTSSHLLAAVPAAVYYLSSQVVVTAVVAILLLRFRCPSFRLHRNALVLSQAIGLVIFWVYPVAPPRMLPDHIDTVALILPFLSHQVAGHTADQYAAFPSLHVVWALWVAIALQLLLRRRAWRVAAWTYPLLTTADVFATANHYVLDVLAAPALLGLAYALAYAVAAGWLAMGRALNRMLDRRRVRYAPVLALIIALAREGKAP